MRATQRNTEEKLYTLYTQYLYPWETTIVEKGIYFKAILSAIT
jgi:hypothetical protein